MEIMKTWTAPSPEGKDITYEIYDEQARNDIATLKNDVDNKEASGTAETKVSEHNTNTEAHNDIRLLIEGLTARLNALANSDDTTLDQMAEVVAYIKSNRTLIESVTTDKVNVTDIINNLTTNVANKPLSAAQGVVLKGLIDTLQTAVNAIKVPTKTSELTDDVGFAKQEEVDGLSEEIADLKSTDYVVAEAETVADLILEKMNANCLVGAFVTDIHLERNQTATETAIKHAGMGINEIRKITPLDFVANLGDNGEMEESHKFIYKALYNAILGTDSFWLRGNHEGSAYNFSDGEGYETLVTDDEVYKFVGTKNKGHVINADDRKGMYGYKDYEDLRLRIIYLNTSEIFENSISSSTANVIMSTTQINWLQNTALNFSDKADVTKWKVLVLSHAPLDWNTSTQQAVTVLDNYVSSGSGAKIIGNIHGHVHNCNVGTIGTNEIPRIAIPQVCADRYNEYSSYGSSYAKWGEFAEDGTTPIYYYKGTGNATDTMFCVVVIDCENEKIYAITFGATTASTSDGSYTKNVRVREISFDGTGTEEPAATLSSISATYTGGEVVEGTALTALTGLTVIATYSDGSTAPVTGYTLSGTIAEGSNTITVSYGGLTTTFTVIGTASTPTPSYTNQIPLSVNADGSEYVGHNGEDGYSADYRVNSSGTEVAQSGMCCTGYIPYDSETIRLKDVTVTGTKDAYIAQYQPDKTFKQVVSLSSALTDDGTGVLTGSMTHNGFIRISCGVIDDTTILTLDEEITDSNVNYTNLADPTDGYWKEGYRINSSNAQVEAQYNTCTNLIPFKKGDIIYAKGIKMGIAGSNTGGEIVAGSNGAGYVRFGISTNGTSATGTIQLSSSYANALTVVDGIEIIDTSLITSLTDSHTHFCLVGILEGASDDVIITVNEEIK